MAISEHIPATNADHATCKTPSACTGRKVALYGVLCVLLCVLASSIGCTHRAYAESNAVVHVSYQWYKADTGMTEDFEVFDAVAVTDGVTMSACVMSEAYDLSNGCSWRVMKNFAGGVPAGEQDITSEAAYDGRAGVLSLPARRAGEDLTIVFTMPWDHESHQDHGHFNGAALPRALQGGLRAADAGGLSAAGTESLVVGTTYPLTVFPGGNGLESDPMIYGADVDVTDAGTVMGYPELNGRYKFYVSFIEANCELFQIVGQLPGRQGNGGTIYGGSGIPYDYSWAGDFKWCVADCVENVYNTAGMPVPLGGSGSWIRIDSIEGSTISCTFRIECNNPDGTNAQDIMGTFELEAPKGALSFQKRSSREALSNGNACYSLAGAKYGVFATEGAARSRDEAGLLATYITDENGAWESGNDFRPGTYYIVELAAPAGYALSDEVIAATVGAGATTSKTASDNPLTGPAYVRVAKRDHATGASSPQGNGTLEGAEITFRYYDGYYTSATLPAVPTRTWVMRTTAQGIASPLHGANAKVAGDELYLDSGGNAAIPLGTVTAIETRAPVGYALGTPTLYVMHIAQDPATGSVVATTIEPSAAATSDEGMPVIDEVEKRGNIAIVKTDATTGRRSPQGDATLAGARFAIVNRSAFPVVSPQTGEVVPVGETVCTIVTDSTGYAATDRAEVNGWSMPASFSGKALAYGTYEIVEAAPPSGYLLDEEFSATVDIDTDGQVIEVAASNPVARGGVIVGKVSRENGLGLEQGASELAGWSFEIVNRSAGPVVVDGAQCDPGDVVATITTRASERGYTAETAADALPVGTYEVHELQGKRPQDGGYLFDEESQAWSATFSISDDGQVVDLAEPGDACANQVVRGDVSFAKVESPSMRRLVGVPFKITSQTTGEWHVIVTDANGMASTASDHCEHTYKTNANDAAIDASGAIDESALDREAGVWFDGALDAPTTPDDAKGALPFDTYLVEELHVQANEGLNLVSFEVTVTRDGASIELGTIDDVKGVQPQISTSLENADGGKLVAAGAMATLVDTVTYNNLDTTARYRLEGAVHLVEDGVAGDAVATAAMEFSPNTTHGTVQLFFEGIDTSALANCSLVCFERLCDESGRELASHEDPTDEGQTVSVPTIATELVDAASGEHAVTIESPCAYALTDTVSYAGLVPRKTYTVNGSLHGKSTGQAVLDAEGTPVTASTTFSPSTSAGTVQLTFAFTAPELLDTSIVAFESLSHHGTEYAVHADLEDEAQTVTISAIHTSFTSVDDGSHAIPQRGPVKLADAISYANLVPGSPYTAVATLYDKTTGLPVPGKGAPDGSESDSPENSPLTSSCTFTPESATGTTEVLFEIDADELPASAVCFERVFDASGRLVALHEDLGAQNQTVSKPEIATTLLDADSNTHMAASGTAYRFIDTIAYKGLQPGKTYTANGTLHLRHTGEALTDANGAEVRASADFTPEKPDGTVEVTFSFENDELAGTSLVAFESLAADGHVFAEHADLEDESQTVGIPRIDTTFSDAGTGKHSASGVGPYRLVDRISYEGLEPNRTYSVVGAIMDKQSGKPLAAAGEAVTASIEFTPATSSGTVDVPFNLDDSTPGGTYVAFERVYADEQLVAVHEDIDAASQTVSIPRLTTTALDAGNGKHEAGAAKEACIVDEVRYAGLQAGSSYRIRGTLMDKATGKAAVIAGANVTATHDFKPTGTAGSEKMQFPLSGQELAGMSFVVFEKLYLVEDDGTETFVCSHEDINSAAQTVTYRKPAIGDVFDKTGYWLLQHWPIAMLGAAAAIAGGILLRGRRRTWHATGRKRGLHAARR